MNTQEKELKHCTACNQMTNHSGETCLKHTPDTEWKRQLRIDFEVAYGSMPKNFEHVPSVHISDWWLEKLTSRDTYWAKEKERAYFKGYNAGLADGTGAPLIVIEKIREERDTYWKERVRKEVEGIKYVEPQGERGKIYNEALYALLDNLK